MPSIEKWTLMMVAIYLFTSHGYKETITEGISEDKEEAWNSFSLALTKALERNVTILYLVTL